MSKITLEPNSSGAGTFSIVSPDSNTNRTLNLPDEDGTVLSSVSTNVPADGLVGQFDTLNMPTGSVIQTVSATFDDISQITSSESPIDSGANISITPKASDSKIMIIFHFNHRGRAASNDTDAEAYSYIFKNDSVELNRVLLFNKVSENQHEQLTLTYIDDPGTTNSIKYSLYHATRNGGDSSINTNWSKIVLILMEIAG